MQIIEQLNTSTASTSTSSSTTMEVDTTTTPTKSVDPNDRNKPPQLIKSKSLEDVRTENLDGSQPSHEMEFVSSRIQKLKVQE